jgi:hypothetical protein
MLQGTFLVIRGTFGMIRGTFLVIRGTFGMIQGTFGVIQGTFGVVQGTFGVVQGTFGVVQGTFGVVQGTFGVIQGCIRWPRLETAPATADTSLPKVHSDDAAERGRNPEGSSNALGPSSTHSLRIFSTSSSSSGCRAKKRAPGPMPILRACWGLGFRV